MSAGSPGMQGGLEDLLGDLWYARRCGDLGRLALLTYWEVRRWARLAGEHVIAERSSVLMTDCPKASREDFLSQIDRLIAELEEVHAEQVESAREGRLQFGLDAAQPRQVPG